MKKLLLVFSLLLWCTTLLGSEIQEQKDSLKSLLDNTVIPQERFKLLKQIANIYQDSSQEAHWLQQLMNESLTNKDFDMHEWSVRQLTRLYNNLDNEDCVNFYAHYSDSLSKKSGRYSDHYFATQLLYNQYLIEKHHLEKATLNANYLYETAKAYNSNMGIVCSNECLALINTYIGLDSIAANYHLEAVQILPKEKETMGLRAQLLTDLIASLLKMKDLDDAEEYIEELENHIDEMYENKVYYPYDRGWMMLYTYKIELATYQKRYSEIPAYIAKVESHAPKVVTPYMFFYYETCLARYYKSIGQNSTALRMVDAAISKTAVENSRFQLGRLKADILTEQGLFREAAVEYRNITNIYEQSIKQQFIENISELSNMHNIKNLQLKINKLEIQKLKDKQTRIVAWIVFAIFLSGCFFYWNTFRLNQKLNREKKELQISEDKYRLACEHAMESDRQKSLFLSNMSHEICTPLNAIVGFANILIEGDIEKEEKEEYVKIINNNSDLLLNLINDILDFSKIESEKYRFSFDYHNLQECCYNVLESIKSKVKPSVKLSFITDGDTDTNFRLYTDKLRFQQVLINLIGNACKFTQNGFISLSYKFDKEAKLVYFSVTDTGSGIPLDKQEQIFERFVKLNTFVQGTGLGLSICKLIVERLGGKIWLDKKYSEGCRFIFTHPLAQ